MGLTLVVAFEHGFWWARRQHWRTEYSSALEGGAPPPANYHQFPSFRIARESRSTGASTTIAPRVARAKLSDMDASLSMVIFMGGRLLY